MGIDVRKVVESVRDELKETYRQYPMAIWSRPKVVVVRHGNEAEELGGLEPAQMYEWLKSFHDKHGITDVVVGTMVIEYSAVQGIDGNPVVKRKAILVHGRNLSSGRVVASVTYVNEHRDYRTAEAIEKDGQLENPAVSSPDVTKAIMGEDGKIEGWMTGQFGKEALYDAKEGWKCEKDPLIEGVLGGGA